MSRSSLCFCKKLGGSGVLMVFAGLLLVLNDGSLSESSSTELTVRNLYLELKEVSAEWERLGFLLGLQQDRLDAIERDCSNVDICYRRMLHAWYDESLNPSWDIVTWTLGQMGKKRLAKLIRERYIYDCDSCDCEKSSCIHEYADTEANVLGNYAERMQEIESRYIELAYDVMTSMEMKEVNLKKVKFWLTQLPVNLIYTQEHLLEGKHIQLISRAQNLIEVFGYLRSYWNFLDYGLLEYMAITFGNDEVKQLMRRYIHELTSFRKVIPLSEFMKLWPNRIDPPPEFSKLVTKLNITQSHWTLQDAEEFRLTFAKNYSLVTFALMYGTFVQGSLVLTWFIPSSVAPQLVQDVRNGGSGFLKEHNIIEVSIDGHTVAIVDSNGKIWNLSAHITTPVHFWSTRYAYLLQPGINTVLSCLKTCAKASPPLWCHTLSKDPWLPMSLVATGPELELSLHQPPVTADVGYFCCACVGDHPKVDANCFGVAYMPHVAHFSITQKGKEAISGAHIGDHITVECEVFGFPSHVDIAGHSEIELPQYTEVSVTWYSKMQYINIPHATINHSGVYTCAALLHASPDLCLMTENVKRSLVVYAPPTITDMRRLTQNELKIFNYPLDSDVILCRVTSSVFFNVTWLFNGKVMNYASNKCSMDSHRFGTEKFTCALEVARASRKGTYTCIVNTAFETRESIQILNSHLVLVVLPSTVVIIFITAIAILVVQHRLRTLKQHRSTSEEPLQTTELPTSEVTLQTTESPTSEVTLQTTESPTSEVTLQTTESPTSEEALQTTELPTTEEPLQTTELPTSKEPLQTTELPMSKEALQTTELATTEEPLQTAELPTSEETLQTTVLSMNEEALQTTDSPTTKEPLHEEILESPKPLLTIGGVSNPSGIAVNSRGRFAVAEHNCISIFTSSGEKVSTFRISSEPCQFWHPCGVVFDSAGNILVTDILSHCIKKFTPEGKLLTTVGRKGSKKLEFSYPAGIGISHSNNKVYVCDRWNSRIQILNDDLTFSSSFGSRGSGYGEFKFPHDVAFDSNGNAYIADSVNCRIQVFTWEGKFLRKFGKRGSARGKLYFPSSVSIDSNDIVYVTERDNHRVSIFTCQGKFIQSFGIKGARPGEFNEPRSIAVNGLVCVSDTFNHRVQGFKKDPSLPTEGKLSLSWTQTSKPAPMTISRGSATVCGNMAYFRPGFSRCVLSYNSNSEEMSTLPACPKKYFSLTVVNGLVTAVGGWLYPAWLGPKKSTNTILSLVARKGGRRKWVEHFPPMPIKRDLAAVVCNGKVLVVVGGVQEDGRKLTTVEVMNTDTLEWSTASSLPHALYAASATVCGDCIYLVGGCGQRGWTTSVLTCSLSALLQSESNSQVWDTIADLPVTCSTCATLNEQVVAVGGRYSDKKVTNNIYSYNRETKSWEVISQMPTPRCWCLVAVLPHNELMVVGGWTGTSETNIVETAQF